MHGGTPAGVRKEQTAWGIAGDAAAARRTVEVRMSDNMRFDPDDLVSTRCTVADYAGRTVAIEGSPWP